MEAPKDYKRWYWDGMIVYEVPITNVETLVRETIQVFEIEEKQPYTSPTDPTLYDLLNVNPTDTDTAENLKFWNYTNVLKWLNSIKNQSHPKWRNVTGTVLHTESKKPQLITFNAKRTEAGFTIKCYNWGAARWSWLYKIDLIPSEKNPDWYSTVNHINNHKLKLTILWPDVINLQTMLVSLDTALSKKKFKKRTD